MPGPKVARVDVELEHPALGRVDQAMSGRARLLREIEEELELLAGDPISQALGRPLVEVAAVKPADPSPIDLGVAELVHREAGSTGRKPAVVDPQAIADRGLLERGRGPLRGGLLEVELGLDPTIASARLARIGVETHPRLTSIVALERDLDPMPLAGLAKGQLERAARDRVVEAVGVGEADLAVAIEAVAIAVEVPKAQRIPLAAGLVAGPEPAQRIGLNFASFGRVVGAIRAGIRRAELEQAEAEQARGEPGSDQGARGGAARGEHARDDIAGMQPAGPARGPGCDRDVSAELQLLRRSLSGLVYRDAAQAYQRGVALVVMALVYIFTAWPPGAIRAAILAADPTRAGLILSAAMVVHHLASAGLVERMLASDRLAWWWQLPVPRRWWRRLHWRHLITLHLGWLAAMVFGLLPGVQIDPWRSLAIAIAWTGVSLGAAVARVVLRERGRALRLGVAAAAGASVLLTEWVAVELGAAIGLLALVWSQGQLDRPMPELAARRTLRLGWGQASLALARLRLTLLVRRDRPRVAAVLAAELALALAAGLGFDHVGEAAHDLARGAAILACSLGAGLLARSCQLLGRDRALMDSWGIDPRDDRRAELLVASLACLPFSLVAGLALPIAWALELALVLVWASVGALRGRALAELRQGLEAPAIGRFFARTCGATILVIALDSTLPLLAWTAIDGLRMPGANARAEAMRRRVTADLPQRDDHGT